MAVYSNLNRPLYCFLRAVGGFSKYYFQNIHDKAMTLEADAFDNFTSQLIQQNTEKWIAKKSNKKLLNNVKATKDSPTDIGNVEGLPIERINVMFNELMEIGDNSAILRLITECIKYRKCPSLSNLMYVLSYCAQNGDKGTIQQIKALCEELHPDILKVNSDFNHYLAEAIWVKGNISESLKLFRRVYEDNAYLRRKIRLTFKCLITDVVSKRSEAALITIVKFSEDLIKDFNDFFPLMCIWQVCFLSEWYTDQSLAFELLEKNNGLLNAVANRIPYVVSESLSNHKTEVVYRLVEILLKCNMKANYSGVLLALLNYQVRQGDIRRCLEIVRWSVKHDVELPTIHHQKFLNLLLRYNIEVHTLEASRRRKIGTDYKF